MFYKYLGKGNYIYSLQDKLETLKDFQNEKIALPIIIDTEFFGEKRLGVTVQMKGIFEKKGEIYLHQDFNKYCQENRLITRHKTIDEDLSVITYLKDLGYPIKLYKTMYEDELTKKILYIDLYAHFGIAELLMVASGELKNELQDIVRECSKEKKEKGKYSDKGYFSKIEMNRRLKTASYRNNGDYIEDAIYLPYQVQLYGQCYKLKLRYIDTYGLHGVSSYKNLCESVGIELKFKDDLTKEQKENMIDTYFSFPEKFDNYSLGDLEIFNILVANSDMFKEIYKTLNIIEYYKYPNLTMGSTVQNLFKHKLFSYFGIKSEDDKLQKKLIELCEYGSSSILKQEIHDTTAYLSKVFGGRCRNNKPLDHYTESLLVDIDIDGCYGNGLRNQIYPIGKPIIESYPVKGKNNYLTLRQWLKRCKYNSSDNILVYGLWTAIVDSTKPLKYDQDFLISWFNFKYKEIPNFTSIQDDENDDYEINPKSGLVKIFLNEVINSTINEDFLDWLFHVCNKNQRSELLDNLVVKASIYYPKNDEVKSFQELLEKSKIEDENDVSITNNEIITTIKTNSFWYGIKLDEFIIDDLLAWRKIYPKNPTKHPLNTLYKLIINSIYGLFASPYFDISNGVVGNNITARARFMCYLMEKGFNMKQSITDGGIFELNKIVFPNRTTKINANSLTGLYKLSDKEKREKKHILLNPLDNAKLIEFDKQLATIKYESETIKLNKNDFLCWINEKSKEHLQKIFSLKIRILNQETKQLKVTVEKINGITKPKKSFFVSKGMFNLEVKDIYKLGCFHGTANYYLKDFNDDYKLSFRSYQSEKDLQSKKLLRRHKNFDLIDNELREKEDFLYISPSEFFISQLSNSKGIVRSKSFIKNTILKINEYRNNWKKYDNLGYVIGDTIQKSGLLRELSLSQFTLKNKLQYDTIDKEINRNKRRYGQSYEGYFVDKKTGLLNYEEMINFIDNAIENDVMSINKLIDCNDHRLRDRNIIHPEKLILEKIKEYINTKKEDLNDVSKVIFFSDYEDLEIEEIEEKIIDFELF